MIISTRQKWSEEFSLDGMIHNNLEFITFYEQLLTILGNIVLSVEEANGGRSPVIFSLCTVCLGN